jgi:hypothetical protein
MIENVTQSEFVDRFKFSQDHKDNFSYSGLCALYEELEQLEEDTGQDIKFDMIGICCEFQEFTNIEEFNDAYGMDCKTLEDIQYYTQVIPYKNPRIPGYIYPRKILPYILDENTSNKQLRELMTYDGFIIQNF